MTCRRHLNFFLKPFLFVGLSTIFAACAPVRQPVPPGDIPTPRPVSITEEQYGHSVLEKLSEEYHLDYNDPALQRIQAIVDRLAKAAEADKDPWHVFLFAADNVKNAAATRGNHVFVWSGMVKAVKDDEELAAVIAHEMAHVLAGHTDPDPNEEVKKILVGVGSLAAGIAVAAATNNPYISHDLGNLTAALTQEVAEGIAVNPYTRELELEADRVGLMLMAEARYNPEAAERFWSRSESDPDFSAGIPFFSTHPVAEDRLANIRSALTLARERYNGTAALPSETALEPIAATGPERDSFDIRKQSTSPPAEALHLEKRPSAPSRQQDSKQIRQATKKWRVVSARAILYADADEHSRKLGEFPEGSTVKVIRTRRGWLQIETPEQGFLKGVDLSPTDE